MTHTKATRGALDSIKKILATLDGKARALVLAKLIALPALPVDVDADQERARIERALATCSASMDRAAAMLGYSRKTLQNRMRQLAMARVHNGRPRKHSSLALGPEV